jgi:hypothetical protein
VGEADSRRWLSAIDRLLALRPVIMVPGHGPVSRDPARDLVLTRDYLLYLRQQMGRAVADLVPFDQAYAATEPVRGRSRLRGRQPHQRLRDLSPDGEGIAGEVAPLARQGYFRLE